MSEWTRKTIAECADNEPYSTQIGPFGKALTPEEYTLSGVPLLRGVNVNHDRFYDDGFVFISEETANRLYKYESYPGDVLLVHKGTLGQIGLMPKKRKYHRYIMGNSMLRVKCDEKKLIPEYLYYWLCSREGQHYLLSRVSQVGVPQIQKPLATLREASLLVPSLDEQKAITPILETIDNKIENLKRQNETLEAIAQILFKHWFIDFEFPNADGKPYKSSGGAMVTSELGEIPEGWYIGSLGEFTDISIGRTPPRREVEWFSTKPEDIKWVSIRDMGDCGVYIVNTSEYLTQEAVDKFNIPVIPENTVILSFKLTVGRLAITTEGMLSNEAIAHIKLIDNYLNTEYIYLFLKQYNFSFLGSTSSIATAVNSKSIKSISILIPSEHFVVNFQKSVSSIFRKIKSNTKQIETLTKTRDTLLPKLMSGQLRVN